MGSQKVGKVSHISFMNWKENINYFISLAKKLHCQEYLVQILYTNFQSLQKSTGKVALIYTWSFMWFFFVYNLKPVVFHY